ncbi:MAG: FAD-binding protein, partial [Acidimicrobiales bacterium]
DLAAAGLDPATDWLPIAPAAHYFCGGVLTDLRGATSIPGLWAAGEVTTAGVHGANRLASNSLLDGMVFGTRVVEAVDEGVRGAVASGAMRSLLVSANTPEIGGRFLESSELDGGSDLHEPVADLRSRLQRMMTVEAGVLRSQDSLERARSQLADIAASVGDDEAVATCELRNLVTVAHGLLDSATARTESRGAHTRTDFPETSEDMRLRMVLA